MTICIAAIGKAYDREVVVMATDHMITTGVGQFEHAIVKYRPIRENIIAMLAGQALMFNELVCLDGEESDGTDMKKELCKIKPAEPEGIQSFEAIKKRINENFKAKRKRIIQAEILDTYGLSWAQLQDMLQKPIPNVFVNTILDRTSRFTLGTELLIVGLENGVAKLACVSEFTAVDYRDFNFHAIGSGATQAVNTLLFQKHSKDDSLESTIYDVYKAKKNAEVSPGVGRETDLLVLGSAGLKKLTDEDMTSSQRPKGRGIPLNAFAAGRCAAR